MLACTREGRRADRPVDEGQGVAAKGQGLSPGGAQVHARELGARVVGHGGVTRLIDAVEDADGRRFRAFLGLGTSPRAFAPDGRPGLALPLDLREVSGGTLGLFEGPPVVALADGGILDLAPAPCETGLLKGANATLGFRWDETPAQVAEGLALMAGDHGLTGAVIVNRAPADEGFGPALAQALGGLAVTVVVVDSPLPLGKADIGPENHPLLAPDAPGKDRMERPAPDPWRAPMAEGLVLEAMKWRFLAEARAVLTLDVCDVLAPRGAGPTAFDACVGARRGVIPLFGRRIYPWRVRDAAPARFADHICKPFDLGRMIGRWGCAPAKAGLENIWRLLRVAYARPDPAHDHVFLRAMAVKVPGRAAAELVPKTSLVEDPELLALATRTGWKPVRPPVSRPRAEPTARTAIVTTMKNEGPFILEWLAWHRAIGVDDFLIYTNDCTDGTDRMLALLQDKGLVQHRDNPFRQMDLKPQHAALQAAEDEPVMQEAGWGICMDVDEFLNIRLGDGRLPTLRAAMEAAMPGANMISATWRLFGNAGVHGFEDRPVTAQFTRCAPQVIRKPHQAWGFKTLFRNIAIFKKLGVHRPKGLVPDLWDQVRWLNGSGRPMPRSMFRNGWRSTTETWGYDWVQLNHYAVRSAESFLVKRDRGRVNHVDRDQGLNYWFRMNMNAEEDLSILPRLPMLRAEMDRLLADPDIRAAHGASVAAHRQRIAELREVAEQAAFYAELTSARMEKLCTLQALFGAAVFRAGPQVVPIELNLDTIPPDFFFTVAEGAVPDEEPH